jgi:hypothetical protein
MNCIDRAHACSLCVAIKYARDCASPNEYFTAPAFQETTYSCGFLRGTMRSGEIISVTDIVYIAVQKSRRRSIRPSGSAG